MTLETANNFALWSVDHKLITLSRNQRGALVRALAENTEKAMTKFKRSTSWMLWRNGGGAIGQLVAGAIPAAVGGKTVLTLLDVRLARGVLRSARAAPRQLTSRSSRPTTRSAPRPAHDAPPDLRARRARPEPRRRARSAHLHTSRSHSKARAKKEAPHRKELAVSKEEDLDYRAYYDATYIRAWDLPPNKDVPVIIERVVGEEMKGKEKDAYRRPVVYFRGKKKGLVLNAGMGKAIKGMYGRFTRGWVGKPIALYSTTCEAFGETHDVVRVRPTPPRKNRPVPTETAPAALPEAPIRDAEFEEAPERQEVAQ